MGLVIELALALSLGMTGSDTGYAVRYAPNRMERTAAIRGIPPAACMVAWTKATDRDIGERWLLVDGRTRLRCLVVDLPEITDRPALTRRNIIVEVDYWSGFLLCGASWQGRAAECPVKVKS